MLKIAIPVFAALSIATPGQAKDLDTNPVSVTVPYADLDLSTEAGSAALNARINAAIKKVCERPVGRDLNLWSAWQKCRDKAMDGAIQQVAALRINAPLVASVR